MAERSWVDSDTILRRSAKEEQPCASAVSVNKRLKRRPPADLRFTAKTEKIAGCFLPDGSPVGRSYICQVVPSSEHSMSTPQPEHNHCQPAGNQPWRHKAVRIHRYRGAMKPLLSHLPALQHQEQGPYHGIHGVLEVGNQLARQYRKGRLALIAEKTGNRNGLFLELRE